MTPQILSQLYLQSSDGGVWKITIDTAGELHTEKIGTLPVPSPF